MSMLCRCCGKADNLGLSKGVVSERLTKIVENVFTALDKVKAPDFSTKEELLFTHRWKEDVKKGSSRKSVERGLDF